MSYKGYTDIRAFLNAKLHALSIRICGDRTVLDQEIDQVLLSRTVPVVPLPQPSVKLLTFDEARTIYRKLFEALNKMQYEIERDNLMTIGQRKAIIKVTKYEFNWSPQATFSFILSVIPDKRKRMSSWEIENSKLNKLYMIMSKSDADKVIKRLDQTKKRNLKNAG